MTEAETVIPPRLPKPESLEAKFKLAISLPYDPRAKRKHMLVYGFILDWFHSKYGDALASVRHVATTINARIKERDSEGKELYAGDVHAALTDLVAWGYLHQEKGSGRRASRYVPIWDFVCSVQKIPNATIDAPSVRENTNTSVRETPNTTSDSVRDFMNEDPSTPTRSQDPGTGKDGQECATPTAPPAPPANAAEAAGTAQDEFEQLWNAYDYKKNKREARSAFRKLAPDAALFETIMAAASAWRLSWAAQGNSRAPRFRLDKWLEREEYDCEPPTGYQAKERKAKPAKAKAPDIGVAEADNDNDDEDLEAPGLWIGDVGPFSPFGKFRTEIVGSKVTWLDQYNEQVVLSLKVHPEGSTGTYGVEVDHTFFAQAYDEGKQKRGQAFLAQIARCLNLEGIEDTEELHGKELVCNISNVGSISYFPPRTSAVPGLMERIRSAERARAA